MPVETQRDEAALRDATGDYKQRATHRKREAVLDRGALQVKDPLERSTEPPSGLVFRARLAPEKSRDSHDREERGHERRCPLDFEPRALQLGDEVGALITPHMMSFFVEGAPEPSVLRNENDYATSRPKSLRNLIQNSPILFDVLEYIESPDNVKGAFKGKLASVHLHEIDAAEAGPCDRETLLVEVGSDDVHVWECLVEFGEDVPGPRSQLEKLTSVREVTAECRDDQAVSSPKPEAFGLGARELVERIERKAVAGAQGGSL